MSSPVVACWLISKMASASVFKFLPAGRCLTTTVNSLLQLSALESKSTLCYDRRSVSQSILVSNPHQGPKTRFLLLSDSCGFVDVGRPLWREDESVVYNCCWASPTQSYLPPMNSSNHCASWILIQFLWWPLFYFLLIRPHCELSWSAEMWTEVGWGCCCYVLLRHEGESCCGVAGRGHPVIVLGALCDFLFLTLPWCACSLDSCRDQFPLRPPTCSNSVSVLILHFPFPGMPCADDRPHTT
jgi:hypothetical protein